jgi:hypothetical protein
MEFLPLFLYDPPPPPCITDSFSSVAVTEIVRTISAPKQYWIKQAFGAVAETLTKAH